MANQNPYQPTDEAFARFFSGECNPAEHALIEEWKRKSTENLDEFIRMEILWKDTGIIQSPHERPAMVDIDQAWAQVKTKKATLDNDTHHTTGISFIWKVAAAIALIVSVGYLLYFQSNENADMVHHPATALTEIVLPDESKVTLDSGSSLTYPNGFLSDIRSVSLQGKAFFEIAHNPTKPFQVATGPVVITVLGTTFNVSNLDSQIVVSVVSGKVSVSDGQTERIIVAGEQASYDLSQKGIHISKVPGTGVDHFWRTKTLTFEGITLGEVINTLEAAYQVKITASSPEALNCRLMANFDNESIESILEVIALSQQLQVESISKDHYQLTGSGCGSN